jgi:hypothetical protein|tara:strand:- start:183 stop:494 length:312 start_codon:yes stop_codon:yes gene_type:complete
MAHEEKKKKVDIHGVEIALPVEVMTGGKFDPVKTGKMEAKNWIVGLNKSMYKNKKILQNHPELMDDLDRLHNKIVDIKKNRKTKKASSKKKYAYGGRVAKYKD